MDEKMRLEIALFRFSVIGVLVSGELTHGELTKKISELSNRLYSIPVINNCFEQCLTVFPMPVGNVMSCRARLFQV
jgi:hypothetical protein